jgi:hypothetical protein
VSKHAEADIDLIPTTPGEVAKAIVYIALSAIGLLIAALGDDHLSLIEIVQLVIVVAGAVPVYLIAGTIPKTVSAFIVAGAQALLLVIVDVADLGDVSLVSWLVVLVAAFAGIGVAVVPNAGKPGPIAVVPVSSAPVAQDMQHAIEREKHDREHDVIA